MKLLHATQGISSLITNTGIINVDFADVRTIMQNGGAASWGPASARARTGLEGPGHFEPAARQRPSRRHQPHQHHRGHDLTGEATEISDIIHTCGRRGRDHLGAATDPAIMKRVTVIATGFDRAARRQRRSRGPRHSSTTP
jgi:cell division protein FtsZ